MIFSGLQPQVLEQFDRWSFNESPIYNNAVEAIDSIPLKG